MPRYRDAKLLDLAATPPPEGVEDIAEGLFRAMNTTKKGKLRKKPKVSLAKITAWLLGDAVLDEDDRVLLDAARRAARLQRRAGLLRRRIAKDPEWERLAWRAPDGGRAAL